jgi:serine/threonine protein kinase
VINEQLQSLHKVLGVLVQRYGQGARPSVVAVLECAFPQNSHIIKVIATLIDKVIQGGSQNQIGVLDTELKALQFDQKHLLPILLPLTVRFDVLLNQLIQVQRLGIGEGALHSIAQKFLEESKDELLLAAFKSLQSIGTRLKDIHDNQSKEKLKSERGYRTEATNDLMHGPQNTEVEKVLKQRPLSAAHTDPDQGDDGFAKQGEVIGAQDWTLTHLLGRGGMGSVWKAKNHFGDLGALKLMLPHLVSNDRLIKRFQLEIRAIKKIRHANVVELVDWGRDRHNNQDRWYFVTDFIEGDPLNRILQTQGALSIEKARDLFIQIADGLAAAHEQGVIHRDIKPGNIMIDSNGNPAIIDFGIARQLEDPSMTQTHERVLTLQFASPEQLYGEPVSPQSDVFSLAATLGFCLHPDGKRQRPQFDSSKAPEAFHWILESSLNYDAQQRPKDMHAFRELLEQIKISNGVISHFPRKPKAHSQEQKSANLGLSLDHAFVPGGAQPDLINQKEKPMVIKPTQSVLPHDPSHSLPPQQTLHNLSDEIYHYHGPDGQQKLSLSEIVENIKAKPRSRHLVWQKGWSEWKPWYRVDHLKEYVQALKESNTQHGGVIDPLSEHVISVRGVDHVMVALPPGSFWMGNQNLDAESDEKPRHRVQLNQGFLLGQTQLTQDFYEALTGHNPSTYKYPNHPTERISWFDVIRWCNQLSEDQNLRPAYEIEEENGQIIVRWNQMNDGYRLPSEAEWEYAARAGTNFTYAGSNRPDEVAWFGASRRREGQKTYSVSSKKPNQWNLYDMSGNVWEWCWGDMRQYTARDAVDPLGTTESTYRICRGGSNYLDARQTRCSYRIRYETNYRSLFVGFRIARTLF